MNIELIGEDKNIIRCIEDPSCAPDPRGLGVLFMEKMQKYCNNVAQIEAETGRVTTHGEVLLGSIRVAQHLLARDISQDDVIATCALNNMVSSFPLFAGLFLGVKISSLDPSLPKYELDHLVKLIKPRFLFCDEACADMLAAITRDAKLNTEIIVYGETEKYTPFSDFTQPTGAEMNFQARPVQSVYDTAIIYFSSGTTGYPKGICATHYALQTYQEALRQCCDYSTVLVYTTFYWISATIVLSMTVLGGTARIVTKKFNAETAMDIISKYKVTCALLAQIYSYQLTHKYNSTDFDTSKFNTLLIIGEKLNEEQMKLAKQLFPHTAVSNGYGMTEANGFTCVFNTVRDKHLIETKIGACGRPIQGFTYKIVNPDTEEVLGPYQTGELRIRGAMMNGYLNNPEATKKAFDRDGFLQTGDLAYYDEDYCFYIVDRIKDMLKYQGIMQSAAVLEEILLTHPEINEAVVLGKPNPADGDHPAAFVTLTEGSELTVEQILEYYNEKIIYHEPKKLRGGVYILDEIPRTPSAKPRKGQLRDCCMSNPY